MADIHASQGIQKNISAVESPHLARASRQDHNTPPVNERLASMEGLVDGLKHGQLSVLGSHAVIIGAIAIAFAIIIGGFALLSSNVDSVETKLTSRIDRLEASLQRLPDQLLAIANAINSRQPPVSAPPQAPQKK